MSDETDENLSVGKRDKTMSDMASIAAEAFCDKRTSPSVSDTHKRKPRNVSCVHYPILNRPHSPPSWKGA